VDTGGQEGFVTEGTEKEAKRLQFPPSIFYEIKFCTTHPLFLTEPKLRVAVSSTSSKALSCILDIFFFMEQFKKKGR
jgi:hypothetical protein